MADDRSAPDEDRAAILRRRKFFVSSTLLSTLGSTLTACPPQKTETPGDDPAVKPTVSVPPSPPSATVMPTPTATAPGPSVDGNPELPPVDVPNDVNETARRYFEGLKSTMELVADKLDQAEAQLKKACAIDRPDCDTHWQQVASRLAEVERRRGDLHPRCGGSSDDAKRYDERMKLHMAYIEERVKRIEATIAKQLDSDDDRKRWAEQQEKAVMPRPCLKYSCSDW